MTVRLDCEIETQIQGPELCLQCSIIGIMDNFNSHKRPDYVLHTELEGYQLVSLTCRLVRTDIFPILSDTNQWCQ